MKRVIFLLILSIILQMSLFALDSDLDNIFFSAVEQANIEQVRQLLEEGYEIPGYDAYESSYRSEMPYSDYPVSPLVLAIKNSDLTMIKLLLKYGADINEFDYEGNYPLYTAILMDNIPLVEFLLSKNAGIYTPNIVSSSQFENMIKSPAMHALIKKHMDLQVKPIRELSRDHYNKIVLQDARGNPYGFITFESPDEQTPIKKILKDEALYPYHGKVNYKDVVRITNINNMYYNHLFNAGVGVLTGLFGLACSIPAGIMTGLGAYYFPHDYMVSGGNYYGTIGTVFWSCAGVFLGHSVAALFGLLINIIRYNFHKTRILKQLNKGIDFKQQGISISFAIISVWSDPVLRLR